MNFPTPSPLSQSCYFLTKLGIAPATFRCSCLGTPAGRQGNRTAAHKEQLSALSQRKKEKKKSRKWTSLMLWNWKPGGREPQPTRVHATVGGIPKCFTNKESRLSSSITRTQYPAGEEKWSWMILMHDNLVMRGFCWDQVQLGIRLHLQKCYQWPNWNSPKSIGGINVTENKFKCLLIN